MGDEEQKPKLPRPQQLGDGPSSLESVLGDEYDLDLFRTFRDVAGDGITTESFGDAEHSHEYVRTEKDNSYEYSRRWKTTDPETGKEIRLIDTYAITKDKLGEIVKGLTKNVDGGEVLPENGFPIDLKDCDVHMQYIALYQGPPKFIGSITQRKDSKGKTLKMSKGGAYNGEFNGLPETNGDIADSVPYLQKMVEALQRP